MPQPGDVPGTLGIRHITVLAAIATDHTQSTIARELHMSCRTVRRILTEATQILGAHGEKQALALAVLEGHLDPDHLRAGTYPRPEPDRVRRRFRWHTTKEIMP